VLSVSSGRSRLVRCQDVAQLGLPNFGRENRSECAQGLQIAPFYRHSALLEPASSLEIYEIMPIKSTKLMEQLYRHLKHATH
jgi:hypothetical protein